MMEKRKRQGMKRGGGTCLTARAPAPLSSLQDQRHEPLSSGLLSADSISLLLEAVRTRNEELAQTWKRSEQWATIEQLCSAVDDERGTDSTSLPGMWPFPLM
ncbi:hypothetical protein P7K49_012098 [Saguinus oedipus]|uniref:Uncharacterized protein n=1 Tax=Saguinus oedipus TaxID=9490 RepID=A0ABQ9VSJ3_SAGOE|nr:hypothetical protein P7K49_012098 [Saguinus oedipus]